MTEIATTWQLCLLLDRNNNFLILTIFIMEQLTPIYVKLLIDYFQLSNVNCIGTEASLDECPHSAWGDPTCGDDGEAGVKCVPLIITGKVT